MFLFFVLAIVRRTKWEINDFTTNKLAHSKHALSLDRPVKLFYCSHCP